MLSHRLQPTRGVMMAIRLTPSQHEVVDHEDGALLVVAGPGSGKTRVLTERIRRLLQKEGEHFRVLGVTFTNKAANEMVERLQDVPNISERAFIGTLHSFCTEVLANRGKSVGVNGLPNIFDSYQDRKQVLQDAVNAHPDLRRELDSEFDQKRRSQRLDSWLKSIGEYKNNLVVPEMVENETFRRLYIEYNDQLRASDALDFDDLLLLTYRLFEERPKIASFYRRQYRYICVDEAQDLNEAQYRVVCALCGPDYFNVMMVGDPKQAIFMWNGAHPKYLDLFERDFNARKVELQENFRSARSIVDAAKRLDAAYGVEGVLPIEGLVEIVECEDEESEAQFVINTINDLIANGHPDVERDIRLEDCAVIGRNRFVFRELKETLNTDEIPFYTKVSSAAYRSESDIVADFEIALRLLANPLDRLHLGILLQRWATNQAVEDIYDEADLRSLTGEQLLKSIVPHGSDRSTPTVEALEAIGWATQRFRLTDGLTSIEATVASFPDEQRALVMQDIAEWRKHWNYYVRNEPGGSQNVQGFLSQVALGTTQQPSEDGVALLTVHSAKGMEFDVVFVIGMNEGTFPDFRAKGQAMDEEQRNAFVAVTRSRRLLYITYPTAKLMPWGDMKAQQPSRFVKMLRNA